MKLKQNDVSVFWKACGSFPQSIDKHFVLRRIIKHHVPRRAAGACLVCSKQTGTDFRSGAAVRMQPKLT